MDKVKIPKPISTYIEDLLSETTKESFLAGVLGNANSPKYVAIRNHFDGMFDDLLQAIVNGYEVEQTPEDKVREIYDMFESFGVGEEKRALIKQVLDALNTKIKGVNA